VAVFGLNAQEPPASPVVITSYHPIRDAIEMFETRYERLVSFEDPIRAWHGEMQSLPTKDGKEFFAPSRHSFTLPAGLMSPDAPALTAQDLTKVLEAYQEQNPIRPRYRVMESKLGFHIIPTEARDESGTLGPAENPLDALITVPKASRTASEHLQALCAAVSAKTGIPIEVWNLPIDAYYAANGYILPKFLTPEHRPYMVFDWGASGVVARDALIDLLSGSASTLSWQLSCNPDLRHEGKSCLFGTHPLQVGLSKRVVAFDRCTNCRPAPVKEGRPAGMPPIR
jgi:hypothetical protein